MSGWQADRPIRDCPLRFRQPKRGRIGSRWLASLLPTAVNMRQHRPDSEDTANPCLSTALRRDNQDENRATIRMRMRRRGDYEGRA